MGMFLVLVVVVSRVHMHLQTYRGAQHTRLCVWQSYLDQGVFADKAVRQEEADALCRPPLDGGVRTQITDELLGSPGPRPPGSSPVSPMVPTQARSPSIPLQALRAELCLLLTPQFLC